MKKPILNSLLNNLTPRVQKVVDRLPEPFEWTLHNLVSHPLSEIAFLVTKDEALSGQLHDMTIPKHERGTGRG